MFLSLLRNHGIQLSKHELHALLARFGGNQIDYSKALDCLFYNQVTGEWKLQLRTPPPSKPTAITKDEVTRLRQEICRRLNMKYKRIAQAFRAFDINHDGSINEPEFHRGLGEIGIVVNREAFSHVFRQLDRENKGEVEFYTFAEFFSEFRNPRSNAKSPNAKRGLSHRFRTIIQAKTPTPRFNDDASEPVLRNTSLTPRPQRLRFPHTRNPDHYYGKLNEPSDEMSDLISMNYSRDHLTQLNHRFLKNRSFTEARTLARNRKFLGFTPKLTRRTGRVKEAAYA